MSRLGGKVAVITGGASGIGEASVRLFAKEGAQVVIADIMDEKGSAIAKELGKNVIYMHTDVRKEDDIKKSIAMAVKKFKKLDCMFNNAGIPGVMCPIEETDIDEFDKSCKILFRGMFIGIKQAAIIMKKQGFGNIINTASIAGHQTGFAGHTYSACKAAIMHLTYSVAVEVGEFGLRVNCICPGAIATPIIGKALGLSFDEAEGIIDTLKDRLKTVQAIPRSGLPEDVAKAALFLASDDSDFVNGAAIKVDGGIGRTLKEMGFNG